MFRRKQTKKDDLEVSITDGKNVIYDEEIPIEEVDIAHDKTDETNDVSISDSDSEMQLQLPLNSKDDSRYTAETPDETNSSHSGANGAHSGTAKAAVTAATAAATASSSSSSVEKRPKSGVGVRPKPLLLLPAHSKSDSDSDSDDDGLMVMEQAKGPLPGEYDADKFHDLNVNADVKELFQYITKYTPQHLNLDYKFKPFVPDYIPAVGDIDAFLKVVHPDRMLTVTGAGAGLTAATADPGNLNLSFAELGLNVLDEPAANQSDSALLHLQLRAVSVTTNKDNKNMIIKKVENVEKNRKTIEKWIIDVSELHRAKPPPMVTYPNANPMPDVDNLMQEWPAPVELRLRKDGFPSHRLQCTLREYVELACAIFDVPVYERKTQSLHLLFSLYVAIKNSQLYNLGVDNRPAAEGIQLFEGDPGGQADQLILD